MSNASPAENLVDIAPDGRLSLIPFEALALWDGNGWKYLAEEDVEIVYLNTGRDLARAAATKAFARTGLTTALIIDDPDFEAEPAEVAAGLAGLAASADAVATSQPVTLGSSSRPSTPQNEAQMGARKPRTR